MSLKMAIRKELTELAKNGLRRTMHVIEGIDAGRFEEEFEEFETNPIGVSAAADLLCTLAGKA